MNFIKIGATNWLDKNLAKTEFNDGRPISVVKSFEEWRVLCSEGKPCCCPYDFDVKNVKKFGLIYNPFAFESAAEIVPPGTRIATKADWDNLIDSLGGNSPKDNYTPTASLLAIKSNKGWRKQLVQGPSVDMNGTNPSGFSAVPRGDLFIGRSFRVKGFGTRWWTSDWREPHISEYDKHVICFEDGSAPVPGESDSGAYIRLVEG